MAASRVLVLTEGAGAEEDLRLDLFEPAVEFTFRAAGDAAAGRVDLAPFQAVAVQIDCATAGLLEGLKRLSSPPHVFLFHRVPPLREIARWLAWSAGGTNGDGTAARLLSESLEYYSLASLYGQCLRIMSAQEEEKLLGRITETFVQELGAEGCVLWIASPSDPDEMLIAAVRGFLDIGQQGPRFFLSHAEWADRFHGGAPFFLDEGVGAQGRRGAAERSLFVPLKVLETPVGLVKLGPRADRRPYGERERNAARVIADYAARSLRNAARISRMEKVSLRDAETGAFSAAFLSEYLEKELYKASRFRRPLSVVFVVLHNFAFLIERTRESLVVAALASAAEEIRRALRDSDLLARTGPDRFCVVLPETDAFGALLAIRRLRKVLRSKGEISFLGASHRLELFFLPATFPADGRNLQELERAAEETYAEQQKSPYWRLRLQGKPFWEACDALVGKPAYYDQLRTGEDVPFFGRVRRDLGRNGYFVLPRDVLLRMVEAVAQEVAVSPQERGMVIAAGPRPDVFRQIFLSFGTKGERRRIYLVGRGGATRFDAKNFLYVAADDERLSEREIVLSLRETGGYGLFCADRDDEVCGFNTADRWLVEGMMEKFQDLFCLQGHF